MRHCLPLYPGNFCFWGPTVNGGNLATGDAQNIVFVGLLFGILGAAGGARFPPPTASTVVTTILAIPARTPKAIPMSPV